MSTDLQSQIELMLANTSSALDQEKSTIQQLQSIATVTGTLQPSNNSSFAWNEHILIFTAIGNTTWVSTVSSAYVFAVAGGGGGSYNNAGNAGQSVVFYPINLVIGHEYQFTIGYGGTAAANTNISTQTGGVTSITDLTTSTIVLSLAGGETCFTNGESTGAWTVPGVSSPFGSGGTSGASGATPGLSGQGYGSGGGQGWGAIGGNGAPGLCVLLI